MADTQTEESPLSPTLRNGIKRAAERSDYVTISPDEKAFGLRLYRALSKQLHEIAEHYGIDVSER